MSYIMLEMPMDFASNARRTPLFVEVRQRFLAEIAGGRLQVGERLPPAA